MRQILHLLLVSLAHASELRLPNPALNVPEDAPVTNFTLVDAFPNISVTNPLCIATPPGETDRIFVCQQNGILRLIHDISSGTPVRSDFLDLRPILTARGETMTGFSEGGLLGLAFHPQYAVNRHFYVFYSMQISSSERYQRVSRFTTRSDNPNAADPNSELILIQQRDESLNHNGGDLHFGPDGYLYITVGDEGGSNDTLNNSQTINKDLFAGILRIDVDKKPGNVAPTPHPAIPTDNGVARFSIPIDNPFVSTSLGGPWDGTYNGSPVDSATVRREFFVTGLRNPWRMAFDPLTGELWCADVGQHAREEINIFENGDNGGWAFREGDIDGAKSSQAPANFNTLYHKAPLYAYSHGTGDFEGKSVTGGLVYRGTRIPSLTGKYVFADYVSGNIWSLARNPSGPPTVERLAGKTGIVTFGTDPSTGDLLLGDLADDKILRLVLTTPGTGFPTTLTETGLFSDVTTLEPAPGLIPYEVNLPFWSDHALKRRWFTLPDPSARFTWAQEGPWTYPAGTVWVKHFDLPLVHDDPSTAVRLETRLLVKTQTGAYGVSYRWNQAQTEATLVEDAGETIDYTVTDRDGQTRTQTWQIPSRAQCMVCHNDVAGPALSFNTRQLNLNAVIGTYSGNQLETLSAEDFLQPPLTSPDLLPRHLRADENDYSLEARVRSYLAVNCAYCHQPGGTTGGATWDVRPHGTLADTGLLSASVLNNGGNPANRLLKPGQPLDSVLLNRIAARGGFTRMPPLATSELDEDAIDLLSAWIGGPLSDRETYSDWRLRLFGSGTSGQGEPDFDADADGVTNELEFLFGTSPISPGESPRPGLDFAPPALRFTLPENRSFRIWESGDLQNWNLRVAPQNAGLPRAAGTVEFPLDLASPQEFYRIEVLEN